MSRYIDIIAHIISIFLSIKFFLSIFLSPQNSTSNGKFIAMHMSRGAFTKLLEFICRCRLVYLFTFYRFNSDGGSRKNMTDDVAILYVEDNFENRILVMRVLNAEGYSVSFAENATEALAAIDEQDFNLILMDINLPDIDGYTLTAKLRKNPRVQHVPIIALTANVMKGDREKSLDAGCDGYIQKPLDVDALPAQINNFLVR